jgi:hypothetical protein
VNGNVLNTQSDEVHPKTPESSQTGSHSALFSAADYLRGILRPDEASNGSDWGELAGAQWRALKAHCSETGLIVPLPSDLTPGGAEHDFCLRGDKIWKVTRPHRAGCTVSVDESSVLMLPGSPLQYLDRWLLGNRVFGDDAELLGVVESKEGLRIAVSQQIAVGEAPSWEAIESFFVGLGFCRVSPPGLDSCGGHQARAYFKGRYAVFDGIRLTNRTCHFAAEFAEVGG